MNTPFQKLSRQDKISYLEAIAEKRISRPKRFYSQVIITEETGKRTLQGDDVNDPEFLNSLPYKSVIFLPRNGREVP